MIAFCYQFLWFVTETWLARTQTLRLELALEVYLALTVGHPPTSCNIAFLLAF